MIARMAYNPFFVSLDSGYGTVCHIAGISYFW